MVKDAAGTRALTPRDVASPAWSPDGRRLAFARYTPRGEGFDSAIVVAAADGPGARAAVTQRLDDRQTALGEPTWLPDGRTLGYTRTRVEGRYLRPSVFTVAADGGASRRLIADAQSADWSPDGSSVAYSGVRDKVKDGCEADRCEYAGELYVDRIGDSAAPRRLTRSRGDDGAPEWSADGTRIAFSSDRNYPGPGNREIYSIRPDGACLTWLTNGSPASGEPAWRPSGRSPTASPAPTES